MAQLPIRHPRLRWCARASAVMALFVVSAIALIRAADPFTLMFWAALLFVVAVKSLISAPG